MNVNTLLLAIIAAVALGAAVVWSQSGPSELERSMEDLRRAADEVRATH